MPRPCIAGSSLLRHEPIADARSVTMWRWRCGSGSILDASRELAAMRGRSAATHATAAYVHIESAPGAITLQGARLWFHAPNMLPELVVVVASVLE